MWTYFFTFVWSQALWEFTSPDSGSRKHFPKISITWWGFLPFLFHYPLHRGVFATNWMQVHIFNWKCNNYAGMYVAYNCVCSHILVNLESTSWPQPGHRQEARSAGAYCCHVYTDHFIHAIFLDCLYWPSVYVGLSSKFEINLGSSPMCARLQGAWFQCPTHTQIDYNKLAVLN